MARWIDICDVTEFTPGSWRIVDVDIYSVLVFNIEDSYYAIENICTHDGGTLSDGRLEGDEIICPRHGARFCVKNGAVTRPPAYENVRTFAVRVHDAKVQIKDEGED